MVKSFNSKNIGVSGWRIPIIKNYYPSFITEMNDVLLNTGILMPTDIARNPDGTPRQVKEEFKWTTTETINDMKKTDLEISAKTMWDSK